MSYAKDLLDGYVPVLRVGAVPGGRSAHVFLFMSKGDEIIGQPSYFGVTVASGETEITAWLKERSATWEPQMVGDVPVGGAALVVPAYGRVVRAIGHGWYAVSPEDLPFFVPQKGK